MESTINKLITIKNAFSVQAANKALKQSARDDASDKVAALDDAIESLIECFDLKVCDSCGAAFEKGQGLDAICGGCEEHKAARYASDMADLEWHRRTSF